MVLKNYNVRVANQILMPIEEGVYEVYGNDQVLERGKYILVWKPDKNKWKIYGSIGNKDSK